MQTDKQTDITNTLIATLLTALLPGRSDDNYYNVGNGASVSSGRAFGRR